MVPLLDALRSGRVLLMDGAMGTELQRAGLKPGENPATWNLLHPEKVRAVHQAYLDAGAEVVLTNTFLANARSFSETLRQAGCKRSFTERWGQAFEVIGSLAPYRIAAVGPVAGDPSDREFDDLRWFFVPARCPDSTRHKSYDTPHAILLETCSSPRVRFALMGLRKVVSCPLLLSLAYRRNEKGKLVTRSGHSPEWFARRVRLYGAVALGVNCGQDIGMEEIIEIVRRFRDVTDLPLFARPNAGTPRRKGDRWVYPHTPEQMAERLPELLEAGVCMVGGCCGTTPAHIAAFRKVVDGWNSRRPSVTMERSPGVR